ncbi:MAG: hypothetical protein C4B58_14920 [Deltaproteobacteria bacterium]|nr:MAG: hypothetical protein C4B58_14920 [Deltaproteobacteria bacterium]
MKEGEMREIIRYKKDVAVIDDIVSVFKKRMLEWPNPVEYVNNMYGCHPGDDSMEYFIEVFRYENREKPKADF